MDFVDLTTAAEDLRKNLAQVTKEQDVAIASFQRQIDRIEAWLVDFAPMATIIGAAAVANPEHSATKVLKIASDQTLADAQTKMTRLAAIRDAAIAARASV